MEMEVGGKKEQNSSRNARQRQQRCAIIGGGASGLACARWAIAYGVEPVVFEKMPRLGGLWLYKLHADNDIASVMKSTVINTSKEMTAYSDFPPPAHYAPYMHNRKMLAYLEAYASHHQLADHVRFNHTVLNARRADDFELTQQWVVQYTGAEEGGSREVKVEEEVFDAVLLAVGHHAKPNFPGENEQPRIEGMELFKGRLLHAHDYKQPCGFEDKTGVVVGIGNSAIDIAVELSRVCQRTYVSTRRGAWINQRVGPGGRPSDMTRTTRWRSLYLPRLLPKWYRERALRQQLQGRFDHARFGLMPTHGPLAQHTTSNDELPNRLISGTLKIKPNIRRFTPFGTVEWEDGSESEPLDFCILATGYRFDFSLIERGTLISTAQNESRLYKYMYPPELANTTTYGGNGTKSFAVIGLVQPLGSVIAVAEMQARVFFHYFTTPSLKLPPLAEQLVDIESRRVALARRYVRSQRHTIQVDFIAYMDDLGELVGCVPRWWRYLLDGDFSLAHHLLFGANAPYVYRLVGPHSWSGARAALLGMEERVAQGTMTRKLPTRRETVAGGFVPTFGILIGALLLIVVFASNLHNYYNY